ncbi:MAG: molybdopterin-dependent oxidoreductase [Actinobacteria bacterium]|nr:molybdopterin-dependent oxidoreductase [Actinomycetota bacterium]
MSSEREIQQTLCRMCDDRCGIDVHLEDGRMVDITGNRAHVWNKGRLCVKARAAVDMVYHPDRLLTPLKRTADGWQEIPLAQALDEIAERLVEIRERDGARSVSVWKGEAIGFGQQEDIARRFIHAFGSPNYLSNDSMCYAARYFGYKLVDGGWPIADLENARVIVMWGANPPHAHPNMTQYITAARRKGAKLVVVDPRLSAIARRADVHAQPHPGTDGALAWGLMRELIRTGAYDKEFVERHTVGFPELSAYAATFTPEMVEQETGVPVATVIEVAALMGDAAPRVAMYVGNGLEHHENGVNNIRAVVSLDALLGAVDREGGNRFVEPAPLRTLTLYDDVPLTHLGPLGADRFPVLYDLRQECHTMTAMGAILEGDPYPLRAMVLTGANPLLTNPNTERVRRAFEALDLLVVRELFMTETAALAHYVLPAASFLERSELHTHAKHQAITLTCRVCGFPEVQDEYQFWHDLAHRLDMGAYFPWDDETALNRWLLEPSGLTLEELEAHPEGVTYSPLTTAPLERGPFATASGKVEFASRYLKDLGYDELPTYKSPEYRGTPDDEYPFVLVTGARKLLYMHSRFRNIARFRTAEPGPEVEMHPDDARALGVGEGDLVTVTSRVGSVTIPVHVMSPAEIRPGELQITHGWSEANVNLLTHDDRFDPISGFPLMKSVEVRVEKV